MERAPLGRKWKRTKDHQADNSVYQSKDMRKSEKTGEAVWLECGETQGDTAVSHLHVSTKDLKVF